MEHCKPNRVVVEETPEQATAAAAGLFRSIACEAVAQRGVFRVALAGGTTPHAMYPDNIYPMRADAADLSAAAAEYEQTLRRLITDQLDGVPRLDLVLLGMGADGHTASLFPCTPEALDETQRLVLAHHVPVLGRNRMTITLPLINAARNVMLLVTGEDKAPAVGALLGDDDAARVALPVSRVCPRDGLSMLVLDAAANRRSH